MIPRGDHLPPPSTLALPPCRDPSELERRVARNPGVVRRARVPAAALQLSVVVPCFNVGPLARQAIESLLRQSMPALEVVAVDDGSTDDTLRHILAVDDRRVTCITQANRGLAAARNTGILNARGPLIGFCDGDDLWFADKAGKQLALMEADPTLVLTFSYSAYLAEDGAPTGQLLVTRCTRPTTRDLIARNHVGNGSTPIVRRAAFERAGLFDEALESCEDIEMWVRLSLFGGGPLRAVPEPLTGYRVRRSSQMHTFERYIAGSQLYLDRFREYVPGYTARHARRTYAEHLRVLSRKAFSSGQVPLSRRLFAQAVRHSPTLVVRDLRAFAMGGLHVLALALPPAAQAVPYRLGRRLLRRANSRRFRGAPLAG